MRAITRSLFGCFGVMLLTFSSTSAWAEERVLDKKFAATSGGTLTLETDMGSVLVSGGDVNEVIVHVTLRGSRSALNDFEVAMTSDDKGVTIRGHRTEDSWLNLYWLFGQGLHIQYTVQIPRDYRVRTSTSGGDLELRSFNGLVTARTSGGNINLSALNGDIQAKTSGGDIRAAQLVGVTQLRTSGGNVTIDNARGDVSAHTSGGNMRLRNIDGKLYAHTSGGNIDVDLAGVNRGVEVGTSGGNITLAIPKDFAATLNARTSGGSVDCDLPITSTQHGSHERHELRGDINGGGPPLSARTSGGDIRISERR